MDNNKELFPKKVIIIGGGAAGLMAAISSSGRGCETIVLEKNKTIGKKLRITGKGRCNITNDCDIEGLIRNIPGNGNFMYSSLYGFSNHDIIDFFESHNLKTKVERGNRVFPVSDKADEVVNTLIKECIRRGVKILTEKPVGGIEAEGGQARVLL